MRCGLMTIADIQRRMAAVAGRQHFHGESGTVFVLRGGGKGLGIDVKRFDIVKTRQRDRRDGHRQLIAQCASHMTCLRAAQRAFGKTRRTLRRGVRPCGDRLLRREIAADDVLMLVVCDLVIGGGIEIGLLARALPLFGFSPACDPGHGACRQRRHEDSGAKQCADAFRDKRNRAERRGTCLHESLD